MNAVSKPQGKVKEKRDKVVERIKSGLFDYGIFCLSEINDSILMWSHYAENHCGFCVEFEGLENNLDFKCQKFKANYIEEYQCLNDPKLLINFYIEMFSNSKSLSDKKWRSKYKRLGERIKNEEDSMLALAVLTNKFKHWKYEQEWRYISNNIGLSNYNPKCINSITFGVRTSDQDKNIIMNICSTEDKSHIRFKEAVKKSDCFGIDINDLISK